jgi:hypothetical protein
MSVDVAQSLQFLVDEFGYTCSASQLKDLQVLFYRNNNAEKQLEIAYSDGYFHCEIRRLIDGKPAKYSDNLNSISHEDLAIFESNNKYDHFDYYAGSGQRLAGVVKKIAALFKRNKQFFTAAEWIDTAKIQHLKDEEFEQKFGSRPNRDVKPFFDLLREEAITILKKKGFAIIKDSKEGAPYDHDNYLQHITFFRLYNKIVISQSDWRDDYNTYYISRNNKKIIEVNISQTGIEEALNLMVAKLTYL